MRTLIKIVVGGYNREELIIALEEEDVQLAKKILKSQLLGFENKKKTEWLENAVAWVLDDYKIDFQVVEIETVYFYD